MLPAVQRRFAAVDIEGRLLRAGGMQAAPAKNINHDALSMFFAEQPPFASLEVIICSC